MNQQLGELSSLIKKRGSKKVEKFSSRNTLHLDKSLVLDGLGTTNKVWGKGKPSSFKLYTTDQMISKERRKHEMQALQRAANHYIMSNESIGHHRM